MPWGFPGGSVGKEPACDAGDATDMGPIPVGKIPQKKSEVTEHTQHMALLSLAIKIFFTFFWLSKALNMCAQSLQSCLTLCHLWTVVHRASLFMGFFRQEDWSGLPSLPTGDLPKPGIEPMSLAPPELQAGSLPTEPPGKPQKCYKKAKYTCNAGDAIPESGRAPEEQNLLQYSCLENSMDR